MTELTIATQVEAMRSSAAAAPPNLSDPGNLLARSAGVLTTPSAEVRAAQLQLGLDLEAVNADGSIEIPMPATVIVEPDAIVRWIDVHPDYGTRSEPVEILAALDALSDR